MTLDQLRQWCLVLPLDDYVGPTVVALIDSHQALLADVRNAWHNGFDSGNTERNIAVADALTRGDTT